MKKIILIFLFLLIASFSYCQIDNKPKYKNIKITAIDSTKEYYVYRAIEHEKCANDTIIMVKKLGFNNNKKELKLHNEHYYKVLYKYHKEALSNTPHIIHYSDNVRISDYNFPPMLILNYSEIQKSEQEFSNSECFEDIHIEDFEIFLRNFIKNPKFRDKRINFETVIKSRNYTNRQGKKYTNEWKIYEQILVNYKDAGLKRDKYFNSDLNRMFFRLYGHNKSNLWIQYSFLLDEKGKWHLSWYLPFPNNF